MRPVPAFGPGSVDFIQQQARKLETADAATGGGSRRDSDDVGKSSSGNYAGAGSYF